MFDQPAVITAGGQDEWLSFEIHGRGQPLDVYKLIAFAGEAPVEGFFDYAATLNIPMQPSGKKGQIGGQGETNQGIANLSVLSNLVGLNVGLPAQFGKTSIESAPLELDVQFLADYQTVRWEYKSTHGWMHYTDQIQRGAIGVNAPPPITSEETQAIVLGGKMDTLVLSDWVSDRGESSVALPLDWTIRGMSVDLFVIDDLGFSDVQLSGQQVGQEVAFDLTSTDLAGTVKIPSSGPLELDIASLTLPISSPSPNSKNDKGQVGIDGLQVGATQAPHEFVLSVDAGASLPAAKVKIDQLFLGAEAFGKWGFEIQPEVSDKQAGVIDVITLSNFDADVNGVHITDAQIVWDLDKNVSTFVGDLVLDDLEQTLPLWEFPVAIQTGTANLGVDGHWRGSPVDVSMLGINGEMNFTAQDGRFLEVDSGSGGLKMLSLVNFSKAAKRFSFDFSDVVGDGISFDTLSARVALQDGQLSFIERMRLKGSSGAYQIGGQIDLNKGVLDNEMIVTLPVSNSLPWYGFYLALANPLAGLGVLVGERVLRKPIEQFSSAKFSVKGTLAEPEINFVSLWDQSLKEVQPANSDAEG